MKFKELRIDTNEKLCYLKNNILPLTKAEYNILKFLLKNRNKIFSREELKEIAWSKYTSNRAVDATISRLRKKLNDYNQHIITRFGFGYGFKEIPETLKS